MTRQTGKVGLIVVVFLILGCSTPATRTVASSDEAQPDSLVYEKGAWSKRDISVCFGSASQYAITGLPKLVGTEPSYRLTPKVIGKYSEHEKVIVRSIINREYTSGRTGAYFVGWGDCDQTASKADVVLFIGGDAYQDGLSGLASVGKNLDVDSYDARTGDYPNSKLNAQKKSFVFLSRLDLKQWPEAKISAREFLELTALHEFGHVLGLGHEHVRVFKNEPDLNCKLTRGIYSELMKQDVPKGLGENVRTTGPYDPSSIMNYCWMEIIEKVTGTAFIIDSDLPEFVQAPVKKTVVRKTRNSETVRYVIDKPIKTADGRLPLSSISLTDPTLYVAEKISEIQTRYRIKIGLSQGDLHALRCFYQYDLKTKEKLCHDER